MRYLFAIIATLFSLHSLAEYTEDLSQILMDSHCIPVRGADGNVSTYKCDGPLGEKMKQGKFQNLGIQIVKKMELKQGDVITSANGEAAENPAKAKELYNSMKATDPMAVQRPASIIDKIKSCLAGVYANQISFHKAKGTYTSAIEEFGLNRISECKGLDVSADYANQSVFKFVAKSGDRAWSIDETKTMEEIR